MKFMKYVITVVFIVHQKWKRDNDRANAKMSK